MTLEIPKVYILPGLDKLVQRKLRLFILPDGNNRAEYKFAKNYSDGGRNVVNIIEMLVARGDIEEVVFGLLSPENIAKRDVDRTEMPFFDKLHQAFLKLGIAIGLEGKLIKSNVRLEIEGNLDRLRQRGGSAEKLANLIDYVVRMTWTNEPPEMTVKFAVDYSANVLIDQGTDILIRSGMEEEAAFRSSGLKLNPDIICKSFTDLWPVLDPQNISTEIDKIKNDGCKTFASGYNARLLAVLEQLYSPENKLKIAVPYSGGMSRAIEDVSKMLGDDNVRQKINVSLHGEEGQKPLNGPFGKIDVDFITKEAFRNPDLQWYSDFVVAPGQNAGNVFRIPEQPEIAYATIFGAANTPDGIIQAVKRGCDFLDRHPRLIGASRISEMEKVDDDSSFSEFYYLNGYKQFFLRDVSYSSDQLEYLADQVMKVKNNYRNVRYNLVADLFVAKQLAWAEDFGIDFDQPSQLRALLNYCYVSFFMTYVPDHPEWQAIADKWLERAENLSRYMIVVFLFDDRIYDLKMAQGKKEALMGHATQSFIDGLKLQESFKPIGNSGFVVDENTRNIVATLTTMQNDFISRIDQDDLESEKSLRLRRRYAGLIRSHHKEYFYREGLEIDANSEKNIQRRMFLSELGVEPGVIEYLIGVEQSIGASMAYEVVLASCDTRDVPEGVLSSFDEIFFLTNIYYRLVNDASEIFKNKQDQESGLNAVQIVRENFSENHSDGALINSEVKVLDYARKLKSILDSKRKALFEEVKYPQILPLILAIIRSDFAESFYKDTHFKVAKRQEVGRFFDEKYWLGINK